MLPASLSISAHWPRLAEAGGRPELDLALEGRIKAGGELTGLWAAAVHIGVVREDAQQEVRPQPAVVAMHLLPRRPVHTGEQAVLGHG